jgi:nicotinate-nucleotide adenylyltransferase
MRVALFGGTFDPIHNGHLAVAAAAADAFALDRVLFAPTGRQPLKTRTAVASFPDRLAMVTLALAESTSSAIFLPSSIDQPKPDAAPNYTVDTLSELAALHPGADLFAIAGADSFLTLRGWRSPDRLLELAQWIVVSRPGFPLTEPQLAPLALTPDQRTRVHLLTTVHEDVSATALRLRLRAGDPCTDLLPPAVSTYIATHHLYR